MNYVYVIVSDENDFYAEQAWISSYSLKKYNPTANVIIVCDFETYNITNNKRKILDQFADLIIPIEIPNEFSIMQKSRFLKTSLRRFIIGDFIYLDSDTIIADNLNELEQFNAEIAVVPDDWHLENPTYSITAYNKNRNPDDIYQKKIDKFYNSGVMLCRETPNVNSLFEKWHKRWLKSSINYNYNYDQTDLWIANKELNNIIVDLHKNYNCAIKNHKLVLKNIQSSKIVHYYSSLENFTFLYVKNEDFLKSIRKNGLPANIGLIIENIKTDCLKEIEICGHKLEGHKVTIKLLQSILRYQWLTKFLEKIYSLFYKKIGKISLKSDHF